MIGLMHHEARTLMQHLLLSEEQEVRSGNAGEYFDRQPLLEGRKHADV